MGGGIHALVVLPMGDRAHRFFFLLLVFGEFLSELCLKTRVLFSLSATRLTHDPGLDENQKKKKTPCLTEAG